METCDQEAVALVLEGAADYIEANGWVQGRSLGDQLTRGTCVPVCSGMALTIKHESQLGKIAPYSVTPFDSMAWRARHLAEYAMHIYLDVSADADWSIIQWNDTPGREEWEILDGLRDCAKLVRAGDIQVH